MMTLDEMKDVLKRIRVPEFVEEIRVSHGSFDAFRDVQRDYCLFVQIGRTDAHLDVYRRRDERRSALTNNPFHWPADEHEFRQHVVTAILMGVAHETIEQVSDGGHVMCAPHRYKGGTTPDTEQWLFLLDSLRDVVGEYTTRMMVGQ